MDRAAVRSDLIALVVLSSGFGLFTAQAIARTAFFAPDAPWWAYALMGNVMVMQVVGVVGRFRKLLAAVEAREASSMHPVA